MSGEAVKAKSDLGVRTVSAIVMVAIVGVALWLGGIWRNLFFAAIGVATYIEFVGLILKAGSNLLLRTAALIAGAIYIGLATYFLIEIETLKYLLLLVCMMIMIDSGAYFVGRTLKGPKIAPKISPSKTWAGLLGAALGAYLVIQILIVVDGVNDGFSVSSAFVDLHLTIILAITFAVVAQIGDFFESWLKRRAGVKDSSNLIPGHGGIFDRVDGYLPVLILIGGVLEPMAKGFHI